jgi:23S rRNA pseudouridine1911/1915/1917 synthase
VSRIDHTVAARAPLGEAVARAIGGDPGAARSLVEAGSVFVDGRRIKDPRRMVAPGARLVIHGRPIEAPAPSPILYEDEAIVALDKLPGEQLNESETSARESIVERLRRRHPEVRVVHRLDLETSGVVVLAKDGATAELLSAAFRERRVEKVYLALLEGALEDQTIDAPIATDPRRPRARRVSPQGQAAITRVETVRRAHGLSAVIARPHTGRTHQIRVHLAHLGAPIAGDRLYGGPRALRIEDRVIRLERVLLHAHRLRLPLAGGWREIEAPIPTDLAQFSLFGLGW